MEKKWQKEWRQRNPNYGKEWREKNKESITIQKREYRLAHLKEIADSFYGRNYGITIEEYETMVINQSGKCAICGAVPKKLFVDHDHEHNKARGLLCTQCNFGIGYFHENITAMKNAIDYLNKYKET